MGDKSSLIEKFKGLETKEKYLVVASLVTALGFILPWIDIPLMGSINALHGWLVIIFLLSLVTAGLVLYDQKKYALIGTFVVGGLLLLKFFDLITVETFWDAVIANLKGDTHRWGHHFGAFFNFEILDFLKLGFYVTYLSAIAMVYYGIKCFRKEK